MASIISPISDPNDKNSQEINDGKISQNSKNKGNRNKNSNEEENPDQNNLAS